MSHIFGFVKSHQPLLLLERLVVGYAYIKEIFLPVACPLNNAKRQKQCYENWLSDFLLHTFQPIESVASTHRRILSRSTLTICGASKLNPSVHRNILD
ncbi:hypothetical protein B9Z55_023986 [Caenorhabditis nigoni]|nr:hypothetical protein B9Z55_023986 [Caenorhabditis nigoni]